ncbi:hypothetical protein A9X02_18495 [Mycobacterium malmoense]|nr:hypothetical protein A9X02_18495 [Mycobacterium malmoense]
MRREWARAERLADRSPRAVRRARDEEAAPRPARAFLGGASSASSSPVSRPDSARNIACSLATTPLTTDLTSLGGASSGAFGAEVVWCDIPKYHLVNPISSTMPAVPSISGKRSMRG